MKMRIGPDWGKWSGDILSTTLCCNPLPRNCPSNPPPPPFLAPGIGVMQGSLAP